MTSMIVCNINASIIIFNLDSVEWVDWGSESITGQIYISYVRWYEVSINIIYLEALAESRRFKTKVLYKLTPIILLQKRLCELIKLN